MKKIKMQRNEWAEFVTKRAFKRTPVSFILMNKFKYSAFTSAAICLLFLSDTKDSKGTVCHMGHFFKKKWLTKTKH